MDDQNFNIDAAMIILKYSVKLINSQDICDTAQNGLQAFEKVVENVKKNNETMTTYDLILMDCNMPIMDGYESADKIRRYLQSLGIGQPVILAVTGHTENHYVKRAIDCGMNQVFSKPLRGELLKAILSMIGFLEKPN